MQKVLWSIPLLIAVLGAPTVHAQTYYTADFSLLSPNLSAPTLDGTIAYNSSTGSLSPITWTWDSTEVTLTPYSSNDVGVSPSDSFQWSCHTNGPDNIGGPSWCDVWDFDGHGQILYATFTGTSYEAPEGIGSYGDMTLVPLATTPEPSSFGLMLLGMGCLAGFVLGKRLL